MAESNNKLKLNILTPRGVKFKREADSLSMRAIDGDLGILPNHIPMTSVLGDGILTIVNNGIEEKLALFEGIIEVRNNFVNILTTIAQRPEEIDIERARMEKEEAENLIKEGQEDFLIKSSLVEIRRALVRIEVGVHSSDQGYFDDEEKDLEGSDDDTFG